jgi:iron complex transport system substrate-binding protein
MKAAMRILMILGFVIAGLKPCATSPIVIAGLKACATGAIAVGDVALGPAFVAQGFSPANAFGASVAQTAGMPRRIVSLVPATTEMLFAMGAGDRVVGIGSYDLYPPEAQTRPKLGGLLDPDVERLLAIKPDLVILYSTQTELRRQLDRAAVPTFQYVHRGLPDITETIRALGDRVGDAAAGRALAGRLDAQLAAIRTRVANRPRPRTLLVIGREPGSIRGVVASGGYGFLHDMLELAGADDILADIKRESAPVSTEMLLGRAPEAIIELHYGRSLPQAGFEAERRAWNALPSIPAVKNRRILFLVGNEFVVPGPRIGDATERLARALHPEAFK